MSDRRTSSEWWSEVRGDRARLLEWLRKQYHGEVLAAERVRKFRDDFVPPESKWFATLGTIAEQEANHAEWVAELLRARGETPRLLPKEERYWNVVLQGTTAGEDLAAAAAHAEEMRLERILVIAHDPLADGDIREVFLRIEPDERFHAKAFRAMAGEDAMRRALAAHEAGMAAINVAMESDGLIPDGM